MRILLFLLSFCLTANAYQFHPMEGELEAGRLERYEKQAQRDPVLKALIEMYQGDYAAGLQALPQNLDVYGENLRQYLTFMNATVTPFETLISTSGFVLRFNYRDGVLQTGAFEALSECRKNVKNWIGFDPGEDIVVEIFRKKKEFAAATTLGDELLKKSGVIGMARFHRLMLITPEALPFGYSWQDSMCHEYLHHALKVLAPGLPLWFHEGFARHNETIWRNTKYEPTPGDKEELLLAAKDGKLVTFARMEPSMVYLKDEGEISLAFTQVGLSMGALASKLPQFLSKAPGDNFNGVFRKVYGKTLEEFEKEMWKSWADEAKAKGIEKKSGAMRTVLSMETQVEEKIFLGPKAANLISLGDQMRGRGSHAAAARLYKQAVEQEPANPYALSRLARARLALKQEEEALKIAQTLVQSNPQWPPGYEILGNIYEEKGLYPEAIEAYKQYLVYNPYHQALQKKIGLLHLDLAQWRLAEPYVERAIILNPKDREALEAKEGIEDKK